MQRVFSNSPAGDFFQNPYSRMIRGSKSVWVAAPYVTATSELLEAHRAGKEVRLIVGLNDCTSPKALEQIHGLPNLHIRYFTRRFHAKLYVFEQEALIGSSNLTQGGLNLNREANICVDSEEDLDALRDLFSELWEDADTLSTEKLASFAKSWSGKRGALDPDPLIETAVGRSEPQNSSIASRKRTKESLFLETLRRKVREYGDSFREIDHILTENGIIRNELSTVGPAHRTNRFLNWVRLSKAPGEDMWKSAPLRDLKERRANIEGLAREWVGLKSDGTQIPEYYLEWLRRVLNTFSSKQTLDEAQRQSLTDGLLALHAFNEQLRFVEGGLKNLPSVFWEANKDDIEKVRRSLSFLLFGPGEFVVRLYDFISDPKLKLSYFGRFCGLELFGTIKPHEFPPMNGRTAKAMRYLGYGVSL